MPRALADGYAPVLLHDVEAAFARALGELAKALPEAAEAYRRHVWNGQTQIEIARETGVTRGTVNEGIKRAEAFLAKKFPGYRVNCG